MKHFNIDTVYNLMLKMEKWLIYKDGKMAYLLEFMHNCCIHCPSPYNKIDVTQHTWHPLLRNKQGIFRPQSYTAWQVLCVKMCKYKRNCPFSQIRKKSYTHEKIREQKKQRTTLYKLRFFCPELHNIISVCLITTVQIFAHTPMKLVN